MASPIMEAFSLSHAQILDGSTSFKAAVSADANDIYGVNSASLEPSTDEYKNEGDNTILSSWGWVNDSTVKVQAGYISFPVIASMTGRSISSSGSGDTQRFEIDLWHEDDMNAASKPMLIRMPSKDKNGVVRTLDIGLYRVAFKPITFDGPQYKDGLKVNYEGVAVYSPNDELGAAFSDGKKRVGKLISWG